MFYEHVNMYSHMLNECSTYVHLITPTFAVSAHPLCVNNQPQNVYDIKLGLYKHMKQVYGWIFAYKELIFFMILFNLSSNSLQRGCTYGGHRCVISMRGHEAGFSGDMGGV